jgi:predicted kinase
VRQVTLVYGPPCAGKSTFVQERALPGDVVLDFDVIARRGVPISG